MLRLVTPATFEPVTLDEAKLHLKIDHNADDALITTLITAARSAVENFTQASLVRQTWRYTLDSTARVLELPFATPLVSVDLCGFYQADDTMNVLDVSDYGVDTESLPGKLVLRESLWVSDLREYSGFFVEYTAGPDDPSSTPAIPKLAVLVTLSYFYENRDDLKADLPIGVKALLAPYRVLGPLPFLTVVR